MVKIVNLIQNNKFNYGFVKPKVAKYLRKQINCQNRLQKTTILYPNSDDVCTYRNKELIWKSRYVPIPSMADVGYPLFYLQKRNRTFYKFIRRSIIISVSFFLLPHPSSAHSRSVSFHRKKTRQIRGSIPAKNTREKCVREGKKNKKWNAHESHFLLQPLTRKRWSFVFNLFESKRNSFFLLLLLYRIWSIHLLIRWSGGMAIYTAPSGFSE